MSQKPLHILVIEDTQLHIDSAIEQFNNPELYLLTLAKNYEQAKQALYQKQQPSHPTYDILLSDLMMPKGGPQTMSPQGMEYIYDQLPYGYPLLFDAVNQNIPRIAIVTDINHHNHPMSAAIDTLSSAYWDNAKSQTSLYTINNSKVGIFHAPFLEDGAKDWKKVLDILTNTQ